MSEEVNIEFRADDDCFARGKKLMQYMGFLNPERLSTVLAEGLSIYMKLDKTKPAAKNGESE